MRRLTHVHANARPMTHPSDHAGNRWANLGLTLNAGIMVVSSFAVPALARRSGGRLGRVLGLGCAALAALLLGTAGVRDRWGAIVTIAALGFPWSITQSIPYAMVAERARPEQRGLLMGLLNVFVVLPQLLDLLLVYLADPKPRAFLLLGGAAAALAALLAAALRFPAPAAGRRAPASGGGRRGAT